MNYIMALNLFIRRIFFSSQIEKKRKFCNSIMSQTLSQILHCHQIPEETAKAILQEYANALLMSSYEVDDSAISEQYEVSSFDKDTILKEVPYIKRGDVVHKKGGSSYRNDDKKMWDGIEAIDLYHRIDDYGGSSSRIYA